MALIARLRELRSAGLHHVAGDARSRHGRSRARPGGRFCRTAGWSAASATCAGLRTRYQARLQVGGRVMNAFWRVVWIVARKDLAIEARSRELLNTTVFFALSCVIVFSVSFVGEGETAGRSAMRPPAFSGSRLRSPARWRSAARSSASATATRCARCCWRRAPRPAVYVGKLVGIVALLLATEIVIVPLVALAVSGDALRAPAAAGRRCCCWARSALRASARCSRPCWCARAAATCCCRSCCIRSQFRS